MEPGLSLGSGGPGCPGRSTLVIAQRFAKQQQDFGMALSLSASGFPSVKWNSWWYF